MIAEMSSVLIVGRKRDALEVVRALQDVGVVQIDPLDTAELPRSTLVGPEAERRASLERQLARVESILAAVGEAGVSPSPTKLKTMGDIGPFLEDLGHRSDVLVRERAELEGELGTVNTYRAAARALADLVGTLDRSERLAVVGFTIADAAELARLEAALNENLSGRYALGTRSVGAANVLAGAVAVRKADAASARAALGRAGIGELRFPGRFGELPLSEAAARMEERGRTAPEELAGIREGLERIRREDGGVLLAARLELRDEVARYAALEAGARGRYGFAMRGWLPDDRKPALEAALAPLAGQVVHTYEKPDLHHPQNVPVKLENNAFVRPFELLMGIFAPPGYGTFDPTWVIAVFFPIFFGFVIGDIGFGLISLAVALLLRGMAGAGRTLNLGPFGVSIPPRPLRNVATILTWMSLWSIAFGFVYGEVFGTLGENLGLFHIVPYEATATTEVDAGPGGENSSVRDQGEGVTPVEEEAREHGPLTAEEVRHANEEARRGIPVLLPRVKTDYAGTMLLLALLPGILQILYGWFVRFRLGVAHGDRHHLFEGLGMFVGLVGVILYAYYFRNSATAPGILVPIAIACILGFVVCAVLTGGLAGAMMPIEILSNGGNILSYLRLYAVGLSSALLANLATDMGWNLGVSLGPIGLVIGIVLASIVHFVAIALTIIGHVLQPLRLHYAEFFTKFGFYDSSGRPYRPFARLGGSSAAGR